MLDGERPVSHFSYHPQTINLTPLVTRSEKQNPYGGLTDIIIDSRTMHGKGPCDYIQEADIASGGSLVEGRAEVDPKHRDSRL